MKTHPVALPAPCPDVEPRDLSSGDSHKAIWSWNLSSTEVSLWQHISLNLQPASACWLHVFLLSILHSEILLRRAWLRIAILWSASNEDCWSALYRDIPVIYHRGRCHRGIQSSTSCGWGTRLLNPCPKRQSCCTHADTWALPGVLSSHRYGWHIGIWVS